MECCCRYSSNRSSLGVTEQSKTQYMKQGSFEGGIELSWSKRKRLSREDGVED